MKCSNCGTEYADVLVQCPVCGAPRDVQGQMQQSYGGQYQQNVQHSYGEQYQQNEQQPYGGQQYQQNMQQSYGGQYQQSVQQPYGGQYRQNMQQPYGGQYQQNMQQSYGGQYQQNMQQPHGGQYQQSVQQMNNAEMNMGWFKFTIYFQLFANALLNLFNGVSYLTGYLYGGNSALVYTVYPSLKAFDVCFGIIYMFIVGYAIYTRMMLAKYKKAGPLNLYILLGANILMGILSNVAILAYVGTDVLDASDMTSFGRQLAATITLLIVDIVYFNKRKHLFVN